MRKKFQAFTLVEIIMVVVIIGVIAAFSIPNYSRSFQKAQERNMIANLKVLRSAIAIYVSNGGSVGNWGNITAINSNLQLGIVSSNAATAYACSNGGGNSCTATLWGWTLGFDNTNNNYIYCLAGGSCPTCSNAPLTRDCQ